MKPHRIAYVVNVFPKLSETFIAGELAELRQRGVDVRILSLRPPETELRHEIVARAGLTDRTVYETSQFRAMLMDLKPALLHAHFATEPTAVASQLATQLEIPFTFTAHGYDVYRRPPADFAERANAAAAVVTVSEANARHIEETFHVPATHIRVIPCGVDIERFRPPPHRATPPHVVCVGRLRPVKDVGLLIEACEILLSRQLEFRCVIAGDGSCRGELDAMKEHAGLGDAVQLVGPATQTQVLSLWRRASIAVLSSRSEGMPVSLMEAASCGVPVVATAVGGVPELVEDGVTGLLTPPGDASALADALERLLRAPDLAARMGEAGRRRVEERFSVRLQVDRLLTLWTELCESNA